MSAYYYDQDDDCEARGADYFDVRDEDEWGCAFPGNCCMAFCDHLIDECHTPEMAAEWMSGEE